MALLGGKGGPLELAEGAVLNLVRRKGRKNTLLAPDGSPLEDDLLTHALGGIGEKVFCSMFGLDHSTSEAAPRRRRRRASWCHAASGVASLVSVPDRRRRPGRWFEVARAKMIRRCLHQLRVAPSHLR